MYENIGEKVKGLARMLAAVVAILGSLLGVFTIAIGSDYRQNWLTVLGLAIIAVSCILAWISYVLLYAFGELVQNSTILVQQHTKNNQGTSSKGNNSQKSNSTAGDTVIKTAQTTSSDNSTMHPVCPKCGSSQFTQFAGQKICFNCGEKYNSDEEPHVKG